MGMLESMTVKLGNRNCWMVNRMGWLGNMQERLVNSLEMWVSTGWLGNTKGKLENTQGLKDRRAAMESSVVRSANSLEMWASTAVTLGCNSDLLVSTVGLLENRLDW